MRGRASRFRPIPSGSASSMRRFRIRRRPISSRRSTTSSATCKSSRPMDRLLCGDVGFGKTELAIRAAFKAIDAGYQVAVLVPTTVLAEQHRRTFTARMAEFPFQIASISRFCTAKEQREIIERAANGSARYSDRHASDGVAGRAVSESGPA